MADGGSTTVTALRWIGIAAALVCVGFVGWIRTGSETPPAQAPAPAPPGTHAEIVFVRPPAELGTPGADAWRPARVGDRLDPGETLRTGWGGRAELTLGTSRIRLYENSAFRVPEAPAESRDRSVLLDRGSALFEVLLGGDLERFEVHTPEAVAAVRGTRFGVRAEEDAVELHVYEGSVALSAEGRPEVLVRAGFGASGRGDEPFEVSLIETVDPWRDWARPEAALPRIEDAEWLGETAVRDAREALDGWGEAAWPSPMRGGDDVRRVGSSERPPAAGALGEMPSQPPAATGADPAPQPGARPGNAEKPRAADAAHPASPDFDAADERGWGDAGGFEQDAQGFDEDPAGFEDGGRGLEDDAGGFEDDRDGFDDDRDGFDDTRYDDPAHDYRDDERFDDDGANSGLEPGREQ